MANKSKKIFLFDKKVCDALLPKLKPAFEEDIAETDEKVQSPSLDPDLTKLSISSTTSCSTCAIEFDNIQDQRAHFKLDWHRFNIANKLKGTDPDSKGALETQ